MIIYKITNKVNQKVYIGQTIQSLSQRRSGHIHDVVKNKSNSYLHKAINKYGVDSFDWEIIYECHSNDELDYWEMYFINKYNSMAPGGYNLTCGGGGIRGYRHTDKTKSILRDFTINNNPMNKPEVIRTHKDAIASLTKTSEWIQAHKVGCELYGRSSYIIIYPSNKMSIIKGISEFCSDNNLSQSKMSDMANGNRRFHKMWKCFHLDNNKRLKSWDKYTSIFSSKNNTFKAITPSGDIYFSDSVTDFAKVNNISREWIYDVLRNNRQTHTGWSFSKCSTQEYIDYMERLFMLLG
jgi:group I intron endonuclease